MPTFSGIMVYILVWWMALFCLLPLNIQPLTKPTDGTMPGAPVTHGLTFKAFLATLIACVGWLIIYLIIKSDLISFRVIAQGMRH